MRGCGWALVAPEAADHPAEDCLLLADARQLDPRRWLTLVDPARSHLRRRVLLLGIADPQERADLLRMGFGDVLGPKPIRAEIAARAARVDQAVASIIRQRRCGALVLDLVRRDGFVGDAPLRLNPREFALLWRLMDSPGVAVPKRVLLRDVWHLRFQPETNSLAVHASRLRAKLALAGLGGMVQTAADGGYLLVPAQPDFAGMSGSAEQPLLERAVWKTVLPWEPSS